MKKNGTRGVSGRVFPGMEIRGGVPLLNWRQMQELNMYRKNLVENSELLEDDLKEDAVLFAIQSKVKECHWNSMVGILTDPKQKMQKIRAFPLVNSFVMHFSEFAFPFTFQAQHGKTPSLLHAYQCELIADGTPRAIDENMYLRILSTGPLGIVRENQVHDKDFPYYALNRAIYHTIDFAHQTSVAPFYNLLDMYTPNSAQARELKECFLPGNVPENEMFINHAEHVALCPNNHAYFVGLAGTGSSCRLPTGKGVCEVQTCRQVTGGERHVFAPGNMHLLEKSRDPRVAALPQIRALLDKIHPKGWTIPLTPYTSSQVAIKTGGACPRECAPVPMRVLHIMMFSIALAGVSKSDVYWQNLKTVHLCDLAQLPCAFCSKTREQAVDILLQHLEASFKALAINLNVSKPAAIEFYHFFLDELHKDCLGSFGASQPITNVLHFKEENRRLSIENRLAILCSRQREIKAEIDRVRSTTSQKVSQLEQKVMKFNTSHSWLWEPIIDVSLEQFVAIFQSLHPDQISKFPLIQFWIKNQEVLEGLSYLPETVQWLSWLMDKYNHSVTQEDAINIHLKDVINELVVSGKKNARETFEKFRELWVAAWPHIGRLLGCGDGAAGITDFVLSDDVSIMCCLPGELNENRLPKLVIDTAFSLHNSWMDELKVGSDKEQEEVSVALPNPDLARGNSFLISIHHEEVQDFINVHHIFSVDLFPVLETFLRSRMLSGKQKMKPQLECFQQKGAMMSTYLIPHFFDKNETLVERLSPDQEERLIEQLKDHYEDALQTIENVIRWLSKSSVNFATLVEVPLVTLVKKLHMFNKDHEALFRISPLLENLEIKHVPNAWKLIHHHTTSIPAEWNGQLSQKEKEELLRMIPHVEKHLPIILAVWKEFNTDQLISTDAPDSKLEEYVSYCIEERDDEAAAAFKSHFPEDITLAKSIAALEYVTQISN
eukprot:TRINITY_DN7473_c0_g1_i1.p1 TRINITY_DN7473_c0_g1~~TRINITY_DN7473_c0_g1_i1.p1  ORF type:complete len:946 (-),score=185.08 TRINITY_DN7473_c0_g1_i1:17-2854(-)